MLKKYIIFLNFNVLLFIWSCKNLAEIHPISAINPATSAGSENLAVNDWIYDSMKQYYYWESQLKTKAATNRTLAPDIYFDSLLVQPGVVDRFSWIQDATDLANTLNGINKVLGIRTSPFYTSSSQENVALAIAYVLKGSPAEAAGLKRGDIITAVDGVQITPKNYTTALQNETMTLTLGSFNGQNIISGTQTVKVTKQEVQTNPIQLDTVIVKGNKKIAYLVYLQFLTQYDQALRDVFSRFKNQGVNELVLDLRFNGGGYISSSNILSSLIVKDLQANTLMNRQEWNAQNAGNSVSTNWLNEANNLGTLSRVFILTSAGTASASELIINNLKPKMPVILIGDHTYGKNVGSISITDNLNRWTWGLQPIVLKMYNSLGQSDYGTKTGFLPDFATKDALPFYPFGDARENLLNVAISQITGTNARKDLKTNVDNLVNNANEYRLDNANGEIRDMFVKSKN